MIQEEGEGKPGEAWEVHRSRQAAGKGTFNMDCLIKTGGCTWKMREHTMIDKAMTMQVQVNTSISSPAMNIHPENSHFFMIEIILHVRHLTEGIESFELMSSCFIS